MKAKRALCMLAAILLVVAMILMFLTGCNRQVIDTTGKSRAGKTMMTAIRFR